MKRFIINLLTVLLLINPYFVNTVHAEEGDIITETIDPVEEVEHQDIDEEYIIDDVQEEDIPEVIDEPGQIVEEINNEEELINEPELVHNNLNGLGGVPNGDNDLELSQDNDGNLYITCEDSEFFEGIHENTELIIKYYDGNEFGSPLTSFWIRNSEYFNNNNSVFFETNQGFTVEEDGGSKYLLISKESCLAEHIGSGFIEVGMFNGNWQSNNWKSNRIDFTSIVEKCNDDIDVYEDVINRRIVIESDNIDFLQALALPREQYTDDLTGVYINKGGSSISFDFGWSIQNYRGNPNFSNSGEILYEFNSENSCVYVSEDAIKNNHIKNGDRTIYLYAYGYEIESTNITLTIGCLESPNENDVTVHQDEESGDLIINSTNKDFLQSLVKQEIRDKLGNKVESGSSVAIVMNDYYYHFYNRKSSNYEYIDCVYNEEEQYLCIPLSTLRSRNVPNGNIDQINFEPYGFTYLSFNPNVEISNRLLTPPDDIEIEEDLDGNIAIYSDNLQYLQVLTEIHNNSDISYVAVDLTSNWDNRTHFYNYSNTSLDLILNSNKDIEKDKYSIIINHDRIIGRNVPSGTRNIRIKADGYDLYETTIVIEHAAKYLPTEIEVDVNTSGDMLITCADTDWIESLVNNGYLTFYVGNQQIGYINSYIHNDPFTITNQGKTIIVDAERIANARISAGDYRIRFYARGYVDVYLNDLVTIEHGAKSINSNDVDISFNKTYGTIIISSSNKDYIEKLAYSYIERYNNEDYNPNQNGFGGYVGNGGMGSGGGDDSAYIIISARNDMSIYGHFSNYKTYINGKLTSQQSDLKLSSDHKSLTITKDAIDRAPLVYGFPYSVTLAAKGYQSVSKNIDYLEVGVSPELPNDIDVSFNPSKGIIIHSNNTEWLNGILMKKEGTAMVQLDGTINNAHYWFESYSGITSPFKKENGDVIIPIDILKKVRILSGDYFVTIYSYGFNRYYGQISNPIAGLIQLDKPISFRQSEGRLIIECEDKEFLKALCDTSYQSYILFRTDINDGIGLWNNENNNYIFYDAINEYAYANLDYIREIIKLHYSGSTNFDLHMLIRALGYEDITMDYQLKLIECEETEVIAGTTEQLSFADYNEGVTWTSSNPLIAPIDENGLLKGEKVGTALITAQYTDGTSDVIKIKVTSNSKIALKLKTEDNNLLAFVGEDENLVLTITNYTLEENDVVEYVSSDESIAEFDDTIPNKIHFLKPGKVKITAKAINKEVSINLSVYNVAKEKKLTLTSQNPFIEVNKGPKDLLALKASDKVGEDTIDPSNIAVKYTSSNTSILSVDEHTGKLTAHDKKGSAKITATLVGDPSNRKATCTVQVVDTIIRSIDINELNVDEIEGLSFDNDVVPALDTRVILVDYANLAKNTKFHINIDDCGIAENINDENYNVTPAKVSYVSTDSSVASVDKNGYVTFKKAGQVTITVTVASNPKGYETVSKDIIFKAIDYAPRIETNKFSINKYHNSYPSFNLYKILDTTIGEVKITETNGFDSNLFAIEYTSSGDNVDSFSIKFKDEENKWKVAPKAYSQYIHFKVNGNWYKYKVTVVVASNMPVVTSSITGSYNTFTGENTLSLVNAVKNGGITGIEFVNHWANYDSTTGEITPIIENNGKPAATSGKVRYTFDGYTEDGYVEKTLYLTTKTTKPTVKLDNSTITIYAPEKIYEKTISVKLIDKDKNPITTGTISYDGGLGIEENPTFNDGIITLKVNEIKNGKIKLLYTGNNWNSSMPLTLNIKVSNTLPKAKLSSTKVSLNYYIHPSAVVDINIPNSSEKIAFVEFSDYDSISKDIVRPSFDSNTGKITINPSATGNYKIVCTPYLDNGKPLSPLILSIIETDNLPKMKFKNTTLRLNKAYYELGVNTDYTLSDNPFNESAGYPVFENLNSATGGPMEGIDPIVQGFFSEGKLHLSLSKEAKHVTPGKYKISVTPHYYVCNSDCELGDVAAAPVIITVDLYNETPTVTLTSKDTINPFDSSSSSLISYKLNNLVDNMKEIDVDSSLFKTEKIDDNFYLVIKEDADFSEIKDQTLTINALAKTYLCNAGIPCTIKVKISRKAPSVKFITPTINVYDTTVDENTIVGETDVEFDSDNYEIDIEHSTIPESLGYKVVYNEETHMMQVKMIDGSKIKSGSTQSFNIKLIWKNDYTNNGRYTKSTTLKLNVKDMSYSNTADNKTWYDLPVGQYIINDYSRDSYDNTVSSLKEFFTGKYNKVTYKKVSSPLGEGQIVCVKVNGRTDYDAGQYDPNVPIVIEICNKRIAE